MTKVDVRVKRLHSDAKVPQYAHEWDAGFDLVATEDTIIEPGETKLIPTGLAFQIPIGYELQVRPRSGVSLKTKLRVSNAPGTIDSQFRGEVKVIIDNTFVNYNLQKINGYKTISGDFHSVPTPKLKGPQGGGGQIGAGMVEYGTYIIRKGDRIAQAVLAEVPRANFVVVDELDDTTRGTGGFGSTGVNG